MCRPFYLPRELTVVIAMAVYIPPNANVSTVLPFLHCTINKQRQAHPNRGLHYSWRLQSGMLKDCVSQIYLACELRPGGIIHLTMCIQTLSMPAELCPFTSGSVRPSFTAPHSSLYLLRSNAKPNTKSIKTWPEGVLTQLQDCFTHTEWDIFEQQDLEEYTQTVWIMNPVTSGIFLTRNPGRLSKSRHSS